jgi:hypothetical protein
LDTFVEASGHVNILFGCAKFGQTASRKLYPTFAAVAQLFRLSMLGTFKREEKNSYNEKSDGALVLQTRCFSGVTVCQPDL